MAAARQNAMNAVEFSRKRARIEHRNRGDAKRCRRELSHLASDARAVLVVLNRKLVGWRLPNGEMVCVKERFRDVYSADDAMLRISSAINNDGHRTPVRFYFCSRCGGWHLTSKA